MITLSMDRFIYKEGFKYSTEQSGVDISSISNNILTKIVLLTISFFLLYNVGHSINITTQKVDILRKARQEVDDLRLRNLELSVLLNDMQSIEYLEIQARDRLNFAGEKEYVFVIPENALEKATEDIETILGTKKISSSKSSWEIWVGFLSHGI